MRAFIIVNGQELPTFLARVPFRLPQEKGGHPAFLDVFKVLDETIVMRSVVPVFNEQQAPTGKVLASVTKVDLLFGQFFAKAFLVDATPAPRATPDATGLRRVKDPTAKVAVIPQGATSSLLITAMLTQS
jgi:hypothetical protein